MIISRTKSSWDYSACKLLLLQSYVWLKWVCRVFIGQSEAFVPFFMCLTIKVEAEGEISIVLHNVMWEGAWHPATKMGLAGRIDILTSCIVADLHWLLFPLKPYIQQTCAYTGLLPCPVGEWFWDTHMPVWMPDYTYNILCKTKLHPAFFKKYLLMYNDI